MIRDRRTRVRLVGLAALAVLLWSGVAQPQESGAIFPAPFVVEHTVIQTDGDGSSFQSEMIKDTYGGSWIVSERPDGSRLVIDFSRREVTEIRPAEGRYSVIGFDRMAVLLRDLQELENGPGMTEKRALVAVEGPVLRVDEIAVTDTPQLKLSGSGRPRVEQQAATRFRIVREDPGGEPDRNVLDVWFDAKVRFSQRSLDALEVFETEILAAAGDASSLVEARAMAVARRTAGGRLPIHSIRSLPGGGIAAGTVEDVVQSVKEIAAVPTELVIVPDGLHRTPHPFEVMALYAQREAELDGLMGGDGGAGR